MKNTINRTTAVLVVLVAIATSAWSAQPSSALPGASYEWQFGSSANPAAPDVSPGGAGPAQATIVPGAFASGWMADNAIMGGAQGIWDLGRNGTITLSNPAGLAGDSGQVRLFTIRVVQYQDGGIYSDLTTVSVPGATQAASKAAYADPTDLGDWVVQDTQWSAPVGAAVNSVTVTSAFNGSLVDSVTVLTSAAVVGPPQLTIRSAGPDNSQVQISWPASYSSMVLESTADINNSKDWAQVQAKVQVSGDTASVTLDVAGSASFYRLRQP
jgi:hypothetical protein